MGERQEEWIQGKIVRFIQYFIDRCLTLAGGRFYYSS